MVYFTVVTLADARVGGGRPAKSVVKKKGCHKDELTGFSGRSSLGQPFFFYYELFPQLACDAPRHGDLLVTQVVFHL